MSLEKEIQKTPSLPVLPPALPHLLQVLNNDNIHFVKLAREIESFPTIAAKIIALSNSAWFAPTSPVTSLLDSCARLGLDTVRSISIALSIAEVFDPSRCPQFNARDFWFTALLGAEAAHLCAVDNNEVDVQTARTVGLLYNIGLLWLAYNKPEKTGRAILLSQDDNAKSLTQALQDELATDHHISGRMLAQAMELPTQLADAIAFAHISESDDFSPLVKNMHNSHKLTECVLELVNSTDDNKHQNNEDNNIELLLKRMERLEVIAESLFYS